jgi:predicted nucleic acid-binding protein
MVILDTSVLIDYFRGADVPETAWLNRYMETEVIGLTDLGLCEVLQGARNVAQAAEIRLRLRGFEIAATGGESLAIASAENYRLLRSKGMTVSSTIDCIVATFCIENGHFLLHRDRDFDAFEKHLDLRVIHPQSARLH